MATYVYPGGDLERPNTLLGILGSWWSILFEGQQFVKDICEASASREIQLYYDMIEALDSVSRHTVPIFHKEQWYPLVLLESDRNTDETVPKYGEAGLTYGTSFSYGIGRQLTVSVFPGLSTLRKAPLIMNRILEPSLVLTEGLDYTLDTDTPAITFRYNPFTDERIPQAQVIENGEVVDHQIVLWIFRGDYDWQHIYSQFGYVLGTFMESSENYRDLVNAVFDAIVQGTTLSSVKMALSAMLGVPLVIEPVETVEVILTDDEHKIVATDKNVYKFPLASTVLVSEGETLTAGQAITDGFILHEFANGQTPDIEALALGQAFLPGGYNAELMFQNESVPLIYEVDLDTQRVKLSWEIAGFPADVDKFFDELHAKGVASGQTIANLLDQRPDPEGDPQPLALPATINPLEFLSQNVFRNNAFLVIINAASISSEAAGLGYAYLLRKLIPPHTAMIVLTQLSPIRETVTMDGPGDDTRPGYEETVSSFTGFEIINEPILADSYVNERTISLKQMRGRCV